MSWVRPGIAVVSLCMLRPPTALLPDVDEPAAAIPASGVEVGEVEVVGLDRTPARGEVVVVEDAFAGATPIEVFWFTGVVVESLL